MVRPIVEAFSSSLLRISSCSTFLPFFEFYKYNLSYEWCYFYQIYLSIDLEADFCSSVIGWIVCTCLQARRFQRLLVQRLDCFGWLYFYPWILIILTCTHFLICFLDEYASSFIFSIGQTNMPLAYFSLLYPCFKERLQTLHPHVQRFLFILGLSPLVDKIMEIGFMHHIPWKSKLHIHNINIVHKHGTCLEASAFQGIKNTNRWTKPMTSSIFHSTQFKN